MVCGVISFVFHKLVMCNKAKVTKLPCRNEDYYGVKNRDIAFEISGLEQESYGYEE